jgi:hypothetical protein
MIFNAVDTAGFRSALRGAGFYRRWRQSIGAKGWRLLDAAVGTVG